LEKVASVNSGVTKGRNLNGAAKITVPYMRVVNVLDGHLDLNEIKVIDIKENELNRYLLQSGDILLT
jgi:type I restriction enzyme S subunit